MITIERLKELIHYDPETGIFTWLVQRCGPSVKGERAGHVDEKGYRRITIDGITYKEHRLAWFYMTGKWPARQVDHRDLDKANNRFLNLRQASNSQNQQNTKRRKDNKTGFKGVHRMSGRRRFTACIRINWKLVHLGQFDTAEEAGAAYAEASEKYHGPFGRVA